MLTATLKAVQDTAPDQILRELFDDDTDILYLRYHIWRWYRAVMEYKVYDFMGTPVKLVSLWSQLVKMVYMADRLLQETPVPATPLQPAEEEETETEAKPFAADYAFMRGIYTLYDTYHGQVQYLYLTETEQPLLFFHRFFQSRTKDSWFELLDEWLECALDKVGLGEYADADEMPEALELLQGLCEACWLLYRAVKEKSIAAIPEIRTSLHTAMPGATGQPAILPEKLREVFRETDIEFLHFDLWLWFRSVFEGKPFSFRNDPAMLLYLRRHLGSLMHAARELLQCTPEVLPVYDASATERERLHHLEEIYKAYGGRVTRLSYQETRHPVLYFRRFFAVRSIEAWHTLLEDWLEYGLSSQSAAGSSTAEDMPEALELLQGLCEACWLVYTTEATAHAADAPAAPVADAELAAILQTICASMDAEKIFLLGKYPLQPEELGEEYDLLVLVNSPDKRPMDELESFIRNRSEELAPVHASVMKLSKVNELLKAGNRYFSQCCSADKLVYDAGRIALAVGAIKVPEPAAMLAEHNNMLAKARQFLEGARRYHDSGEYALAVFMLHQAMEHGMNALLVPLLQFRPKTHSLHKLLCFVRRFSMELYTVFPRDTERELALFQVLQHAYIHARYKDNYAVSGEQCGALMERVCLFVGKVPGEFDGLMVHSS